MSKLQWIGLAILIAPFVALFVYIAKRDGLFAAIAVFGFTAIIVAVVFVGAGLLSGAIR